MTNSRTGRHKSAAMGSSGEPVFRKVFICVLQGRNSMGLWKGRERLRTDSNYRQNRR